MSGLMFPFRGMPDWAEAIGEVLPLTHFLRIVRGVMLKGNTLADVFPDLGPLLPSCSPSPRCRCCATARPSTERRAAAVFARRPLIPVPRGA